MTVLQALDRYYARLEAKGGAVQPGWSDWEKIGLVLELGEDGSLLDVRSWLDDDGFPRWQRVPKWFWRSGTGSEPNFLWDNVAYVLGLGDKDPAKTARDHAAFKEMHLRELANETDIGLHALCRFLARWSPDAGLPSGLADRLLDYNICFQLRGEARLLHDRPSAVPHVDRLRMASASHVTGICMVRGEPLSLAPLHPKFKGVAGGKAAEIPLVSFNNSAFRSYGKEQGFNAPISEIVAFRYGAALNELLNRGRNRLTVGDSTLVFWADASAYDAAYAEMTARIAESIFADDFDGNEKLKATDDIAQTAAVAEVLSKWKAARAEPGIATNVWSGVNFHVLALTPNAGRLVVRFWISNSFASFVDALDLHASALAIDPQPWGNTPPRVERLLLKTTVPQRRRDVKVDDIPSGLAGDVTRSVLMGGPYPRTWLATALMRLRAGDDPGTGWHAAAIKACLTRTNRKEALPVSLDPSYDSNAYQLGRLFAVLERAQIEGLGGRPKSSVADRYYAAASSTPARVFAPLLRGAQNHISAAKKRNRGFWIEPRITEIIGRLPPTLPRTLRLEDQGRFAIGYYHERARKSPTTDQNDNEDGEHSKEAE